MMKKGRWHHLRYMTHIVVLRLARGNCRHILGHAQNIQYHVILGWHLYL